MMFLYAVLAGLLCVNFSNGFTTTILPEIEETTWTTETTTQTVEVQASEISETTTETVEVQASEILETTTEASETTQTVETTTEASETTTEASETTTEAPETTTPPSVLILKSGRRCSSTGTASDVLEISCRGYKRCVEGEVFTYYCTGNRVLERDSMTCVRPETSNTGCNGAVSCADKGNGLFANLASKCQTYYWCYEGFNFAQMYCSANLIFNEVIQSCDYPENVEAPCGTKVLQ